MAAHHAEYNSWHVDQEEPAWMLFPFTPRVSRAPYWVLHHSRQQYRLRQASTPAFPDDLSTSYPHSSRPVPLRLRPLADLQEHPIVLLSEATMLHR
jgi:hypothetical protein